MKPEDICGHQGGFVGACFTIHGRMYAANGSPSYRIWIVGSNRILGVHQGIGETACSPPSLLDSLIREDKLIYADFVVRPVTRDQSGVMRMVCVASARHIVTRPAYFIHAGAKTTPVSPTGGQSTDTCPPDAESRASAPQTDVVRIGEHGLQGVPYVSILVDGQRAAWNSTEEALGGPDIDTSDIESVEVLKAYSARRAYGACPGVGLILITTKSKTWRPYPRRGASNPYYRHQEEEPSSTDSGKAIVPSTDSLMATLDGYSEKRVSAAAAAKVIVDYMVGTGKPLNIQMDPELRDEVTREMKARQK